MFKIDAKIQVVVDKGSNILTAIDELQRNEVLVGVPAAKAPRKETEAKGQPINNAALAYIHNYGSPAQNIPARPFMEPGIKNAQDKIESYFEAAGDAAFDGKIFEMRKKMEAAGLTASSSIKLKINTGPFAPLGRATILARRRRGRFGTRPLIDTAQMRNSITYVLRRK